MLYRTLVFALPAVLVSLWILALPSFRAKFARGLEFFRRRRSSQGRGYPKFPTAPVAGEFDFERAIEAYEDLIDTTHNQRPS